MMDWVIEIPQMYMCLDSKVWLVEIIGLKIGRKEQGFLSSISFQSVRSNQVSDFNSRERFSLLSWLASNGKQIV